VVVPELDAQLLLYVERLLGLFVLVLVLLRVLVVAIAAGGAVGVRLCVRSCRRERRARVNQG
jgi:Flp pilus assembly protein TadB